MKSLISFLLLLCSLSIFAQPFTPQEIARWQAQAQGITIIRDNWGVAHVYGKTDADAVFGMLYAQCEDDFPRVEDNYLISIGRKAEVEGESSLYADLRQLLFVDSTQAITYYEKSPKWMKDLLHAFADGINYYLYTHPEVKPKLLTRFQPWMPLTFSEGSIGGDISSVSLNRLKSFYDKDHSTSFLEETPEWMKEPVGSNGFAIAPSRSASGNALLLINPHTSFYFRNELQVVSEQGLNAYGAATWGQFFIYQGFNENCGWMHTSSDADVIDYYLETVEKRGDAYFYKHGDKWLPVISKSITLKYKINETLQSKTFTVYFTHHGPVIGEQDGKWLSVSMMNEPLKALSQSYLRTKAKNYKSYNKVMKLRTNSSNNTVFADRKGNIAYWHGDFMPKRDPKFDWNNQVDGSNPETDWQGLHKVKEIVQVLNPASGWIQNCKATPFTVSGSSSPKQSDYPKYMAPDAENFRGINAVRVLSKKSVFTLDTLIAAANDPYLAGFEKLIPSLIDAYDQKGSRSKNVEEAIKILRTWDKGYGAESVATTIAIYWGEKIQAFARNQVKPGQEFDQLSYTDFVIENTTPDEKINLLIKALDELRRDFDSWKTPWGEVNRFQRLNGAIQATFDDSKPSIPVGFASATWGSLASFGARAYSNTKKRYGSYGNSFVAVVEFGKRLKARAILSGGVSGDPDSPHFTDQAKLYSEGKFKEVLFYREDVRQNAEKTYKPGEKK
ncbi:MAG: penicillin acylase family protein [Saprospiraceae bacterium]|nr:penicillin acylase family protein [Saprospiraceae bacterium]